jgi:hypothetical protein
MNEFDFLAIFISIIFALGVTHLLAGAGRAVYRRKQVPIDEVQMVLTGTTLLILILNWWVFFLWRTRNAWTFEIFLLLMAWTGSFYLLAIFLYPPGALETQTYREIFDRTRVGYYGSLIASILLDILLTAIRGDLLHPHWYLPFVWHYAVLAIVAMGLRKRGFDRFTAWYLLITLLAWSLIARRYLFDI